MAEIPHKAVTAIVARRLKEAGMTMEDLDPEDRGKAVIFASIEHIAVLIGTLTCMVLALGLMIGIMVATAYPVSTWSTVVFIGVGGVAGWMAYRILRRMYTVLVNVVDIL